MAGMKLSGGIIDAELWIGVIMQPVMGRTTYRSQQNNNGTLRT